MITPWPLRAALLALLGAGIGLVIDALMPSSGRPPLAAQAASTGLFTLGLIFALVWDRARPLLALAFAALAATMVAAGTWFSSGVGDFGPDLWRLPCAIIAVAVATPLFQAWRDAPATGPRVPYEFAHDRAWTGLVTLGAALAFTLVSWLLAWLLAGLFKLIGIDTIERLLQNDQFTVALIGAALGGGMGLARDQVSILSTLQRVLRFILSALAPVLAIGLGLFLVALPVTGLAPLWEATKSTTPILLACIAGALVLVNAIIADVPADESQRRPLRMAAAVLLAVILPLAIIAAVSTGARINQYGLTPDRLWAATLVAIALAYGAAPLWALLKPAAWMARVRQGNLLLAFALCAVALVLATPLADFGALSTRSQLARLTSGAVTPAQFDWAALRHDFGPSGVAAVRRLAGAKDADTARLAVQALRSTNRYDLASQQADRQAERDLAATLVVIPQARPVPPALLSLITRQFVCRDRNAICVLYWPDGGTHATLFLAADGTQVPAVRFRQAATGWEPVESATPPSMTDARRAEIRAAIRAGKVEVRRVPSEQLFVDGKPVSVLDEPLPPGIGNAAWD